MMNTIKLSPRESEIVELATEGLTNEAISNKLDLSVGTVNTYWLRIRMKVGGLGRTDTVAIVIKERAETALRAANVDREQLEGHIAEKEASLTEARTSVTILELAIEQIKSAVWATDRDLTLSIMANGSLPTSHFGVVWEVGKTVYEIFKSSDPAHPPIAAHFKALQGKESTLRLKGEYSNMFLRALPLRGEANDIMGCIGIMNYTGE